MIRVDVKDLKGDEILAVPVMSASVSYTHLKEATCTEAGVKVYTCTVCGDTKKEEIPATGHVWDEGKVTTEATTEAEGVKTYTCTICGDTKTEAIPKLDDNDNKGCLLYTSPYYTN